MWFQIHIISCNCVKNSLDFNALLSYLYYRVNHKSLRDFRSLLYSSRDDHAEEEHVNRGRDTPSFCPTLQALDMSTLDDAADVNPIARMWQELDYGIDICRVTKGGHIKRL